MKASITHITLFGYMISMQPAYDVFLFAWFTVHHYSNMGPKKGSGNQPKPSAAEQGPAISADGDPILSAISIVDKKVRNLEKRKVCVGFKGQFYSGCCGV